MNALLVVALAASLAAEQPEEAPTPTDAPEAIRLSAEELEAVPSMLAGSLAAVPLLPGTSPMLSPLALSSVRGKQPSSVGVYVDGVEVPSAFHLLLGPPVFQDGAIESLVYDRGVAPIEHGRRLGGALSIELPTSGEAGLHGTTSMDLLRLGTVDHWTSESGDTRVSAGASLAWTPWLYTRVAGSGSPTWDASRAKLQADLGDYYARAEQRVGAGSVRLLALGSMDGVASASETDLIGAALSFHRVDLRARHPLAGGEAEASLNFGWDRLGAELGGPIAQTQALVTQTSFGAKASWGTRLGDLGTLSVGADASRKAADLAQLWTAKAPVVEGEEPGGPIEAGVRTPIANALLTGAFVQARLSDDPAWRWTLGLRVDDYHLVSARDFVTVEPRVSAWHALSADVSVNAGVALVHQAPTFLLPLPGVDLAGLRFGMQEALRVNAGLGVKLAANTLARLDAYVDPMFRTIELSPLDRDFLQTVKASPADIEAAKQSSGYAHGLELMVRRELSNGWFGWLAWTWQRSMRDQRYAIRNDYGEPIAERSATLPVAFVQEHAASAVAGRTFGRWTLSGAAQFHSGAPEMGGLSSTTQREGLDRLRPGAKWIEADLADADYLPPFFRVDARVAYAFAMGPVDLSASLDVQNVTFGRELMRYSYSEQSGALTRTPSSMLPGIPLPMLGLTARY